MKPWIFSTLIVVLAAATAGQAWGKSAPFPSAKPLLAARIDALEKEIADLILRRPDAPAEEQAFLDLQVDLRVVQRWVLLTGCDAAPESEAQVQCFLRSNQMAVAAAALEDMVKQAPKGSVTRTQSAAMAQLHQLTFHLPGEKKDKEKEGDPNATGGGSLDETCRWVGEAMLNIASPQPIDPKVAPLMRPAKVLRSADPVSGESAADEPRSVEQLTNDVLHAALSVQVRQQLLAMGRQATAPAAAGTSDADAEQAAQVRAVFTDAVILATGTASNTALPQATRQAIEDQLTEGLALFSDPRTRSAGQSRIEGLSQYRQVMGRVSKLPLTAEQRSSFGPAFAYAQNNLDQGSKVLSAIDQFLAVSGAYDAMPKRESPLRQLHKSTEDAQKQFEASRDAFVATANQLGSGSTPESLDAGLTDMKQALEVYQAIFDLPAALDLLGSFRPRPFGGLEAHLVKAAVIAASTTSKQPGHAEAAKTIIDAVKLARAGDDLLQHPLSADVPPTVAQLYAGGQSAEFEGKCRTLIAELASQVASGTDVDKGKLTRLQACKELEDGLRSIVAFEAVLPKLDNLQRWADWNLSIDSIRAVMTPYQQAMSAAFVGMINDSPDGLDHFRHFQAHYLPFIRFVAGEKVYVDACSALPVGFGAQVAELMTPMDKQPFGTERYVSYAGSLWTVCQGDPDLSAAVAHGINDRLDHDLHLSAHNERSVPWAPLHVTAPPGSGPGAPGGP